MFKNGMRPVHPGEVLLEDYIKPMGMSVRALSLALRLERYFGSEAQGWLNLQAAYDLRVAEKLNAKAIQRDIAPYSMTA